MRKDLCTYLPFEHNDFAYIKNFIDMARSENVSTPQGALSATLIYINGVDYVTSHLLSNLGQIINLVANKELFGTVYSLPIKKIDLPLNRLIEGLNGFQFPEKEPLINDLNHFKSIRNKVAHNLLSLTKEELEKIDDDIVDLHQTAERIMVIYDTIVTAIGNIWQIYTSKFQSNTNIPQLPLDLEEGNPDKIKKK